VENVQLNGVAILIVGFRNPVDVCACLAALSHASKEPSFDIFICENGGPDAFRDLCARLESPIGPCTATADELSKSLFSTATQLVDIRCLALKGRSSRVWIGVAERNLGYAGGLNVWLRSLMRAPDWVGVWVLNPDSEPEPTALGALVERSVTGGKGMVGSTIVPLENRDVVHCRGGHRWRKFRSKSAIIGFHEGVNQTVNLHAIESTLDSISGASIYVARSCLEKIGFMDERYFLYYEDADWSLRAKPYGLGYASASVVPHKGGTTIGSARHRAERSWLASYLESRNRILFVRQHWPQFLPFTIIFSVLYALEYLFVGSLQNFSGALKGLVAGLRGETGEPDKRNQGAK
jgi:hypothetical protein